jgi:hypothetical protein
VLPRDELVGDIVCRRDGKEPRPEEDDGGGGKESIHRVVVVVVCGLDI